ncbi:hypothetical protein [Methylorubrum sp. SB2]|uniref:hypothetical protein n=1 Tax=Methylorubrum subtropicum TaxID=3138812 RepID=UPI00313C9E73
MADQVPHRRHAGQVTSRQNCARRHDGDNPERDRLAESEPIRAKADQSGGEEHAQMAEGWVAPLQLR